MIDLLEEKKKIFISVPPPRLEIFKIKEPVPEAEIVKSDVPEKSPIGDRKWKYKYSGTYNPYIKRRSTTPEMREQRRAMVKALMDKGYKNSHEIARMLNEPRGNVLHDMQYIKRTRIPVEIEIAKVKK